MNNEYELTLLVHPDVSFKGAKKCIQEHLDKYTKDYEYAQYVQHNFRITDKNIITKLTHDLDNDSRVMRYLCVSAPRGAK